MFGIMRPEGGCSNKDSSDYRFHRMHYCGVCKAMGNNYGHKSRFLLNYDSVFLAELLTVLSNDDLGKWENAFQAINKCLTMPKGDIPLSLSYAADANVLLAELKIQDQLLDNGTLGWRFAQKFFSNSFGRNAQKLANWGLDKNEILSIGEEQINREKADISFNHISESIDFYAAPTSNLTALIFAKAADIIDQKEKTEILYSLGLNFGKMAYLLDAYSDLEKDIYKGQFNPLVAYYQTERSLAEEQRAEIRCLIDEMLIVCAAHLENLIPENAERYYSRLRSNVMLQMYREAQIPLSFRERLAMRWQHARDFAAEMNCDRTQNLASRIRYQMLSVAVFVAPKTPEYMGVGRDSSIFSWTAFLAAFLAAIGLGVVVGRRKRRKQDRKSAKTLKNVLKAIRSGYFLKRGCWEEILALCCAACACGCFDVCCQAGCNGCWNACEDRNNRLWVWILLAFFIIVGGVTAILLFIL
jgi:hypothetical protein